MVAISRSKKQQEQDDLKAAKKLKPKLRKFLIDKQIQQAAETVKKNEDEATQLAAMESYFKDVIARAKSLSYIAWVERRLWVARPPFFDSQWIHASSWSEQQIHEQHVDIWGFAKYLVKEYFDNYLKLQDSEKGYPNPLDDTNLEFFWEKFNVVDLPLLIAAEKRRVDAGNESDILFKKPE